MSLSTVRVRRGRREWSLLRHPTYGSLTIRNGAILTSDDLAYISDGPFPGSVTVDGPGSRWDHDFDQVQLYVGFGDLGVLDIANGGVVSTFAAGVGAEGGERTTAGRRLGLGAERCARIFPSAAATSVMDPYPVGVGLAQISERRCNQQRDDNGLRPGHNRRRRNPDDHEPLPFLPEDCSAEMGVSRETSIAPAQIAPGDPLGTLAIVGNLTQEAAGKLVFEISGASADAQGHLSITGDATLDGTVEVRFTDGFLPVQGQVFELIDVSRSVSGSFAQVIFPDLRSGFQFSAQFVNGRLSDHGLERWCAGRGPAEHLHPRAGRSWMTTRSSPGSS